MWTQKNPTLNQNKPPCRNQRFREGHLNVCEVTRSYSQHSLWDSHPCAITFFTITIIMLLGTTGVKATGMRGYYPFPLDRCGLAECPCRDWNRFRDNTWCLLQSCEGSRSTQLSILDKKRAAFDFTSLQQQIQTVATKKFWNFKKFTEWSLIAWSFCECCT